MSEVQELVDEIKDRIAAWRLRNRAEPNPTGVDDSTELNTDMPEIEFTPLDPFSASKPQTSARAFADLTPAWIAGQCAPHIFAQGQQLVTRQQVMRAVAHAGRLTGTTRERQYEDQEILFQEGVLTASCTCQKRTPLPASPSTPASGNSNNLIQPQSRTLTCSHVVAVLLAYLQAPPPVLANPAPSRADSAAADKLVCPVTRQTLNPNRPMLQCSHCGLYYSPEGWDFLRKESRGHCCNCNARNTVKEVRVESGQK